MSVLAFFAPATSVIASSQYLSNGSFVTGNGGWNGPTGGPSCSNGLPAVGGWDNQNGLFFSYSQGSVNQQVVVPEPSSLTLSYAVTGIWGGTYQATLADSNETQTTGVLTAVQSPQNQTLSITTTSPNEVVTVTFSGKDGLFWAGCYGPSIKNAALTGEPTTPVIPENSVWQSVWENQTVFLTAPSGSTFASISFISYGLPEGENGQYTINPNCHASLTEQQLSQYLGQSTLEIGAFNHIFGDPCPGAGKRLAVVAQYSPPPTTTIPNFLGAPQGLVVTDTGSSIILDWDASTTDTGIAPERYAISWTDGQGGWGVATGNVGSETALNTEITLDYQLFATTGGLDKEYSFTVRADNDSVSVYSQPSSSVSVFIASPPPPTTTTTTVPETTTTWVSTTTSTVPETTTTTTAPTTTVPATTVPPTTTTSTTTTVPPTTTTVPPTTSPETTTTIPEPALDAGSSDEIIEEILSLEPEELAALIEEIDLSSTSVEAIAAIFSEEVLSELSAEQVNELIADIASTELTDEQAEALSAALSEAPAEVKEAFEEEINVFGGQFDTYIPADSVISVGERRVVVAAGAVIAAAPVAVSSRRR